jgi:hypothetical protein
MPARAWWNLPVADESEPTAADFDSVREPSILPVGIPFAAHPIERAPVRRRVRVRRRPVRQSRILSASLASYVRLRGVRFVSLRLS